MVVDYLCSESNLEVNRQWDPYTSIIDLLFEIGITRQPDRSDMDRHGQCFVFGQARLTNSLLREARARYTTIVVLDPSASPVPSQHLCNLDLDQNCQ